MVRPSQLFEITRQRHAARVGARGRTENPGHTTALARGGHQDAGQMWWWLPCRRKGAIQFTQPTSWAGRPRDRCCDVGDACPTYSSCSAARIAVELCLQTTRRWWAWPCVAVASSNRPRDWASASRPSPTQPSPRVGPSTANVWSVPHSPAVVLCFSDPVEAAGTWRQASENQTLDGKQIPCQPLWFEIESFGVTGAGSHTRCPDFFRKIQRR